VKLGNKLLRGVKDAVAILLTPHRQQRPS